MLNYFRLFLQDSAETGRLTHVLLSVILLVILLRSLKQRPPDLAQFNVAFISFPFHLLEAAYFRRAILLLQFELFQLVLVE